MLLLALLGLLTLIFLYLHLVCVRLRIMFSEVSVEKSTCGQIHIILDRIGVSQVLLFSCGFSSIQSSILIFFFFSGGGSLFFCHNILISHHHGCGHSSPSIILTHEAYFTVFFFLPHILTFCPNPVFFCLILVFLFLSLILLHHA